MSLASTAAKKRWNKAHYVEIKASLSKDLVGQFKEECKMNGVSIAKTLAMLMSDYCCKTSSSKPRKKLSLCDTRPKRRKLAATIATQLEYMLQSETFYREAIPQNLQNSIRAESADFSIEKLGEALDAISGAY